MLDVMAGSRVELLAVTILNDFERFGVQPALQGRLGILDLPMKHWLARWRVLVFDHSRAVLAAV